jgi:catechol 2,3-dioxygenase-like lactoylglutathione lyase family enzyme
MKTMDPERPKIAFVFLDVTDPPAARARFEGVFGLPVLEQRFHPPHHHHGLLKYDAGGVILALNQADPRTFERSRRDGLAMVLDAGRAGPIREAGARLGLPIPARTVATFADPDNHLFQLRERGVGDDTGCRIAELRLEADDLPAASRFCRDTLRFEPVGEGPAWHRFRSGDLHVVLTGRLDPAGGPPARKHGYLLVLLTPRIAATVDELARLGVAFPRPVGTSKIGRTVRFHDPSGHPFCLYEPSPESLDWESGPKVRAMLGMA